ncbi:MAG: IS701 family transposase [Acidobacteria bacterium]|nr:IS701 family transposase [Acidobacteriota bacterium]
MFRSRADRSLAVAARNRTLSRDRKGAVEFKCPRYFSAASKEWAEDSERREKTEVPNEARFQTKPEIALERIRAAVAAKVARGVVVADAAYGINTEFRDGLTELELQYVVGVQSSMTVWEPGKQPLSAKPGGEMGRPPRLLQRSADHQPVSVKQLARNLPSTAFQQITWREGTERKLRSRFAAVRVRPAHRDSWKAEPHAEEWLLIEWPRGETEPTQYWMSTLPLRTHLKALVKMAKHRWIIERNYQALKQELGLGVRLVRATIRNGQNDNCL